MLVFKLLALLEDLRLNLSCALVLNVVLELLSDESLVVALLLLEVLLIRSDLVLVARDHVHNLQEIPIVLQLDVALEMREPRIVQAVIHLHDFDLVVLKVLVNLLDLIDIIHCSLSPLLTLSIHRIVIAQHLMIPELKLFLGLNLGASWKQSSFLIFELLDDVVHLRYTYHMRHILADVHVPDRLLYSIHL